MGDNLLDLTRHLQSFQSAFGVKEAKKVEVSPVLLFKGIRFGYFGYIISYFLVASVCYNEFLVTSWDYRLQNGGMKKDKKRHLYGVAYVK